MNRLLRAFLVSLSFMAVAGAAQAQATSTALPSRCGDPQALPRFLAETYEEHGVAVGLTRNGFRMTLFANSERGSWSLAIESPDTACLIAFGDGFRLGQDADMSATGHTHSGVAMTLTVVEQTKAWSIVFTQQGERIAIVNGEAFAIDDEGVFYGVGA